LPTAIAIETYPADSIYTAAVVWGEPIGFNAASAAAQAVTFAGTITLPTGVTNTNDISLAVTISVNVDAPLVHTVTFEIANGIHMGGGELSQAVKHGENAAPPIVAHRDNAFIGWYTAPNGEGTRWGVGSSVTGNITLYAAWTPQLVPFRVGDVNRNGQITSANATAIAKYIAGHYNFYVELWLPLPICLVAADLNGNNTVDIDDVVLLARWLVGHDVSGLIGE